MQASPKSSNSKAAAFTSAPEFVAVILASSVGQRLFPLTSRDRPKHLLPLGGTPLIQRLLETLQASGFTECVVTVTSEDVTQTATVLGKIEGVVAHEFDGASDTTPAGEQPVLPVVAPSAAVEVAATAVVKAPRKYQVFAFPSIGQGAALPVTLIHLPEDCAGSVQALQTVHEAGVISFNSSLLVVPGDLVVLEHDVIARLVHAHRQEAATAACTLLLSHVGQVDDHGVPLKESTKAKLGLLARSDEEIEYMALSYKTKTTTTPRLVWKQPKLDVEEDTGTGATAKVVLPKPRLRCGITRVGMDWNDVHVYVLAPWVRPLLIHRPMMISIQADVIPLLISRQFLGVAATLGSKVDTAIVDEVVAAFHKNKDTLASMPTLAAQRPTQPDTNPTDAPSALDDSYTVLANVVQEPILFRAQTPAAYLQASKQAVSQQTSTTWPKGTALNGKFQSAVLPDTTIDSKVNFKSVVVGRHCHIGTKGRLNNCILMDRVKVGENCVLQNCVVADHAVIGTGCNLNDCHVGPGAVVPDGTKEKGDAFLAGGV